MFERYTLAARRAVFLARVEAGQYGSWHLDTEHLLLGLLREDKQLAQRAFEKPGAVDSIRKEIEAQISRGVPVPNSTEIPLGSEARRVLEYAADSATRLGHEQIDTVHLLLGILRIESCKAAHLLKAHGLDS